MAGKINWREIVKISEEICRKYYNEHGSKLTLRGLFYILVSKGLVPNTKSAYKRLSAVLSQARYELEFDWRLLADYTREWYNEEPWEYYKTEPLSREEILELIKDKINDMYDISINPWKDQPWRIIIVTEKRALRDTIRRAIKEAFQFGVYQLRVIRGYDSATDIFIVAEDIGMLIDEYNVAVLILSDFDPSGEDIARDFKERVTRVLKKMQVEIKNELVFEKIAITPEQIIELNIPPAPESEEELRKLQRDPRYRKYLQRIQRDPLLRELVEQHGIVRAELDALVSLNYEAFVKILREAITKYFDAEIYEKITKPRLEELKKKAEKAKQETLKNLEQI